MLDCMQKIYAANVKYITIYYYQMYANVPIIQLFDLHMAPNFSTKMLS